MEQRDGPLLLRSLKNSTELRGAPVSNAVKGKWESNVIIPNKSANLSFFSRWHNHLDPYIKKDPINKEEEKKIFDLHK